MKNGTNPHAPAREMEDLPNKLVDQSNETPLDSGTVNIVITAHTPLEIESDLGIGYTQT